MEALFFKIFPYKYTAKNVCCFTLKSRVVKGSKLSSRGASRLEVVAVEALPSSPLVVLGKILNLGFPWSDEESIGSLISLSSLTFELNGVRHRKTG